MAILVKYGRRYLKTLIFLVILLVAQVLCELTLPRYMGQIVDTGIAGGNISYIITTGLIMHALSLVSI